METMVVKDWMTKNVVTATTHTTLPDAHKLMKEHKIRRLPVLDDHGHLVGIITRGDVREASPSDATTLSIYELNYLLAKLTVDKIMTKNPVTVTSDTLVKEAARLMLEHKIGGLPVVENSKVVGIITESDIFRVMVQRL